MRDPSKLFIKVRAIVVALIWLQVSQPASAQTGRQEAAGSVQPENRLTLPLAVEIALRTNPMIRVTASGVELARAHASEARAGRYPILQFNEAVIRSNNPVFVFGSLLEQSRFGPQNFQIGALNSPDSLNNLRTSLTFRIPILDRLTTTRINQADVESRQAELHDEMTRQQVRLEVLKSYYGVLVAEGKKQVADEAVQSAEADVKQIRDRADAGMVVVSDLLAAEVQLAEFKQAAIQAEGDLITAVAGLNTALGAAIDAPHKLAGDLVDRTFSIGTQEELIESAVKHRPEITGSRLSMDSAQEGVRGVKGEFLPRFEIFGGVGVSGRDLSGGSSDYTVGASVTFNIFDAGRKARLTKARAAEDVSAANQERIVNQIRFEVVRSYRQFVSARERLDVARRAVEQAREVLRIVQDRYDAGLTTVTEVLRAETAFVRARTMLLGARYEHYVGYAGVLMATGMLTDIQPFVS